MRILLLVPLLLSLDISAQSRYYVSSSATGTNSGTSWANAYTSLQTALSVAQSGDEIWVAHGNYKPTAGIDRNTSFVIPCGVYLYGGFSGTETSVSERNLAAGYSILDGNINSLQSAADNVYHVIKMSACNDNSSLDGFLIQNGYANGNNENSQGGGLLIATDPGNFTGNLIFQNCSFLHNYAQKGGGLAFVGSQSSLPVCSFVNTVFSFNTTQLDGGAFYANGIIANQGQWNFSDCIFSDCRTQIGNGGALCLENFGGMLQLSNCTITRDSVPLGFEGGGVYISVNESPVFIHFEDSKITNCIAAVGGGFSLSDLGYQSLKPVEIDFVNTEFSNNSSYNEGGALLLYTDSKSLVHIFMDKVKFSRNTAGEEASGIGIHNQGYTGRMDLIIQNSRFETNRGAAPGAGAIAIISPNDDATTKDNVYISNTLFHNNRGAYSITCGPLSKNYTHITNSTFVDNSRYVFNKSWYPGADTATHYNYLDIYNSVIIDTTALKRIFYNNSFDPFSIYDYRVDNCLLSKPDCFYENETVCGENMLYELDPMFIDNTFIPSSCSPLINAGNNLWPDSFGIMTDLLMNDRILFDTVDIGAYESAVQCMSATHQASNYNQLAFRILKNPVSVGEPILLQADIRKPELFVDIFNATGTLYASYKDLEFNGDILQLPGIARAGVYYIYLTNEKSCASVKLIVSD